MSLMMNNCVCALRIIIFVCIRTLMHTFSRNAIVVHRNDAHTLMMVGEEEEEMTFWLMTRDDPASYSCARSKIKSAQFFPFAF